ncbi:MAG: Gx transporter family protein [Candidatus Cloacimonetes bacterium]|nr:Gx transporter family protein [Candidatus Cloacimonadota bacterium]
MIDLSQKSGKNKSLSRLAFFTAFAITIFVAESFIPKPFPFMKLGLANIIVLLLLITDGFRAALIVTLSKSIFGGFFSGILISPATLMSLSGSLISVLVMFLFFHSGINFSLIGLSIIGAVGHNIAQLFVVRMILIKNSSILYLTPVLIVLGIATGIITGFTASMLFKKMQEKL